MKVFNIRLKLELNPGPDRVYTVTSPDVPELFTEGSTLAEIQYNVQDAVKCMIEIYERNGWELPSALQPEQAVSMDQLDFMPVAV